MVLISTRTILIRAVYSFVYINLIRGKREGIYYIDKYPGEPSS